MSTIIQNLERLHSYIASAAIKSRRKIDEITVVAISKKHPPEKILQAINAGQILFGESRVQEILLKIPLLPNKLRWHFIGHLQSNKMRKILPCVELIHSIHSLELAQGIDRIASEMGLYPRVLLEVNVSGEKTKYGFSPEQLEVSLEAMLRLPRIQTEGFMTMAPLESDQESSRRYFATMRNLRDHWAEKMGIPFNTLSMGMSRDYEIAIEEGATLIRIGSAIFNNTTNLEQ